MVKEYREKYGEPDVIEIRQTFNDSLQAREWEHKIIDKMKMCQNDRWLNKGNGQPPGIAWNKGLTKETDERLLKLSDSISRNSWNKGLTKETDERLKIHSETMSNKPSPNKGKVFSEEWKESLSQSHLGNHHSDETKKKMSQTRKGRKHSEEHTRAISQSLLGKRLSDAHKESLRKGWIKRKQNQLKEETNV